MKSVLEFAAEFFEAQAFLQYSHATFLASYTNSINNFYRFFLMGFLGECVNKGQQNFGHAKHVMYVYPSIP